MFKELKKKYERRKEIGTSTFTVRLKEKDGKFIVELLNSDDEVEGTIDKFATVKFNALHKVVRGYFEQG